MMAAPGGRDYRLAGPGQFRVANVQGSSIDHGTGRSWIDRWREVTGRHGRILCGIDDCPNEAEVGGHMYVASGGPEAFDHEHDRYNYILPICQGHNHAKKYDCSGAHRCPAYLKTRNNVVMLRMNENPRIRREPEPDEGSYSDPLITRVRSPARFRELYNGAWGRAFVFIYMEGCPYCVQAWPKVRRLAAETSVPCFVANCDDIDDGSAFLEDVCDEEYPRLFRVVPGEKPTDIIDRPLRTWAGDVRVNAPRGMSAGSAGGAGRAKAPKREHPADRGKCAKDGCTYRSLKSRHLGESRFCQRHYMYGGAGKNPEAAHRGDDGLCWCDRQNERSRGISASKFCGYHRGGAGQMDLDSESEGEDDGRGSGGKRKQELPDTDLCWCGRRSERSRGKSSSKFCGYHYGGAGKPDDDDRDDLCPVCRKPSERSRGISNSKYCSTHRKAASPVKKRRVNAYEECARPGCSHPSERSRGIRYSKFCGYHKFNK